MQGASCPSVIMARHRADRACERRLASGQKQPGARPELEKRSKRNDTASELFPLSAEEYIRVFQHRASLSHMALSLFKCKHIGGALATLRCSANGPLSAGELMMVMAHRFNLTAWECREMASSAWESPLWLNS
jgi:hypothetical protein